MVQVVETRGSRRTKNLFKEALLRLAQKESYALITVTEIVDEADYNRSTFYKHYLDKEDLLEDLITDSLKSLGDVVEKSFSKCAYNEISSLSARDMQLFHYIYDNQRVFSLWKQSDLAVQISQRCTLVIYQRLYEAWIKKSPKEEAAVTSASRVMTYQLIGIIFGWLLNGFQTSPDTLQEEFLHFYHSQKAPLLYEVSRPYKS